MLLQLLAQAGCIKEHGQEVDAGLFTEIKQHRQPRPKDCPAQPLLVWEAAQQGLLTPHQQGIAAKFQPQQAGLQQQKQTEYRYDQAEPDGPSPKRR